RYALSHAPAYQHPRHVVFMPELPLASTGKVDRVALRRLGPGRGGREAGARAPPCRRCSAPACPPPRPGPTDVVLKVRATTLNYHDIFTRRGMPGIKVPMPCIMGVDFAGDIVETGSSVTRWKTGDRVMVDPVDRVGPGGLLGEMWHGGLAEYCRVPTHHLVQLPADVSYDAAACLPVAYGTAVRMMHTIGEVKRG